MARTKRQYGSGCLLEKKGGWVIRWRETEIAPDGSKRRALRYETLGHLSRKQAIQVLAQRLARASEKALIRSRITFRSHVAEWLVKVLPMYKHSTQRNHRHIVEKHLLPRFGEAELSNLTRQEVQGYIAHLNQKGYAPKTIDHIHDVLSAILRTAVKWGHLHDNPARGVDLPELRTVRPKWVLTVPQAAHLLNTLPNLARTMVGLALLCGLRRGELFALRWRDFDDEGKRLHVREAVYEGVFGSPKTGAGTRQLPLSASAWKLLTDWKQAAHRTEPDALVFATRSGKPISPNNVLRRWVFPACAALTLPHATWLTCRRTYSSWAHDKGVPGKVVAQLMGHTKVDTTLNVYTQVLDESVKAAVELVGNELFTIVQWPAGTSALTHCVLPET
jgi:integrase